MGIERSRITDYVTPSDDGASRAEVRGRRSWWNAALRFAVCFLVMLTFSAAAAAQGLPQITGPANSDTGPGSNRSSSQSDRSDLAKQRYIDRQRATLQMWRERSRSRQAVQDAARDSDPEVAERAEWILKQWRSGAVPGVGQMPGDVLLDRGNPSALAVVLEQGAFKAVLVAVEESAGTIEFEQIKDRVARLLTERYPFYADKAFHQGTEQDLLKLLDAVAVNRNLAIATRDLSKHLGIQGDAVNRLPTAASTWDQPEQDIYLAQLAMLDGNVQRSLTFADRSGDPVLIRITRMLADQWPKIATDGMQSAQSAPTIEERIESLAWVLAAAYRLNDNELVADVTERLRNWQPGESETVRNLRWRSLAIHGDMENAINILANENRAAAAKVASAASRYSLATELCDADSTSIDSELDQWIKESFRDQSEFPAGEIAPAMDRLYSLARLLVNTGDTRNALRIYRRLTPRQIIVSPYGTSLREQTLRELDLLNRYDWMLDIAVAPGENAVTQRTQIIVAGALGTESQSFRTVLDQLKLVTPKSSFRDRFRTTFELFRGKIPDGFDPEEDFETLYDSLVHQNQGQGLLSGLQGTRTIKLDLEILEMLGKHGQVELVRDGLAVLGRAGNLDAMIASAETDLKQGDSQSSGKRWQQVATTSAEFTPSALHVTLDHGLAYAKSVVGQWILAKRGGHHKIAAELNRQIRLMMTSPSLQFRKDLSDYLRDSGEYELAVEFLSELSLSAAFGGDEAPDFFKTVVTYVGALDELKESDPDAFARLGIDPLETVKWSDLAIFGILKSDIYYDTAFVSVPLSIRKTFLQHAIETRDEPLARRAIKEIESFDPLNIDYGERMLPELRKAGMEPLADQAFDRLIDSGIRHTQRFPFDATSLNNVAWTAAMNGKRLGEALELSERAVMLEPDSVVYRDTLAEVLHLLGRTEEALAIESACLLDEPDEWHLHEQIKKYRDVLSK